MTSQQSVWRDLNSCSEDILSLKAHFFEFFCEGLVSIFYHISCHLAYIARRTNIHGTLSLAGAVILLNEKVSGAHIKIQIQIEVYIHETVL